MATRGANGSTAPALSGLVHVWFYDIDKLEPPKELDGANLPGPLPNEHPETVPKTWFQGHIFPPSTAPTTQYTILGVPAHSPPQVHGCMVSDHDTPTYYDIYISEYDGSRSKVRFCAYGVERSGGSGDAIEMALSAPAAGTSPSANTANSCFVGAQRASALKLSTTRMMSGDRAQHHLAKYAPDALQTYRGANIAASDCVVCLGVISIRLQ